MPRDKRWEVECYEHLDYDTGLRDDGSQPRRGAIIRSGANPQAAIDAARTASTSLFSLPDSAAHDSE